MLLSELLWTIYSHIFMNSWWTESVMHHVTQSRLTRVCTQSLRSKLTSSSNTETVPLFIVEQIRGPIVQIVIQAPNLARMFFGGYWSNLPDGPLENPRWRPIFFKMAAIFNIQNCFKNKMHLFEGFQ